MERGRGEIDGLLQSLRHAIPADPLCQRRHEAHRVSVGGELPPMVVLVGLGQPFPGFPHPLP